MSFDAQFGMYSKQYSDTKSQNLKSGKLKKKILMSHAIKVSFIYFVYLFISSIENCFLQHYFKKNKNSTCSNCYLWNLRSSLSWGISYHPKQNNTFLDVGSWSLESGANLWDSLFPNRKYGFRQANLPVATFHVRKINFSVKNYSQIWSKQKYSFFVFRIRPGK